MPDLSRPRMYAAALVVGLLLLPGIAIAIGGRAPTDDVANPAPARVVAVPIANYELSGDLDGLQPADLADACGQSGAILVDKEGSGQISPLEQAALNALRPICEHEGLALGVYEPPAGEPDEVVAAQPLPRPAPAATVPPTDPTTSLAPDDDEADTTTATTEHEDDDDDTTTTEHEDDDEDDDDDDSDEPADEPQWVLGTYAAIGGTAGIEFSNDAARVAFTDSKPGYETEVEHEDGGIILIFFKSDEHDSLIRVSWDGAWKVTITEADDF